MQRNEEPQPESQNIPLVGWAAPPWKVDRSAHVKTRLLAYGDSCDRNVPQRFVLKWPSHSARSQGQGPCRCSLLNYRPRCNLYLLAKSPAAWNAAFWQAPPTHFSPLTYSLWLPCREEDFSGNTTAWGTIDWAIAQIGEMSCYCYCLQLSAQLCKQACQVYFYVLKLLQIYVFSRYERHYGILLGHQDRLHAMYHGRALIEAQTVLWSGEFYRNPRVSPYTLSLGGDKQHSTAVCRSHFKTLNIIHSRS